MGIFIKNPETERKARELAALRGEGLTASIDAALEAALIRERSRPARARTLEEMVAATDRFRKAAGLDRPHAPITRADFDALYDDMPGLNEPES